ncbi:MAG: hypothetical protein IJ197_08675 [Bacteroidaceae bacterium]|nr:hypothetical protein [Bacteroidaceae bacterium]
MKGKKTGGRKKGTVNKVTAITRSLINEIASGMIDTVLKDIALLEPKDRVHVFIKLAEFNIAKPQSIDISLSPEKVKTIEQRLGELSQENEK